MTNNVIINCTTRLIKTESDLIEGHVYFVLFYYTGRRQAY